MSGPIRLPGGLWSPDKRTPRHGHQRPQSRRASLNGTFEHVSGRKRELSMQSGSSADSHRIHRSPCPATGSEACARIVSASTAGHWARLSSQRLRQQQAPQRRSTRCSPGTRRRPQIFCRRHELLQCTHLIIAHRAKSRPTSSRSVQDLSDTPHDTIVTQRPQQTLRSHRHTSAE